MERLTQQKLTFLSELLRNVYACHDRDAFANCLLHAISMLTHAESAAFVQIDGRGRIIDMRLEPAPVTLPGFPQPFKRHLAQHPHITYYRQTNDAGAIKLSDFLTRRQFHALELYVKLYKPMRVEYVMSTVLPGLRSGLILLTLHRSRRDFSERDRLLLNLLHPHLVQAYSNAEAVTQMQQGAALLRQTLAVSGQGVVVLTREGRVRLVTRQARAWLTKYFGRPSRSADRLPDTLERWRMGQEALLTEADDALLPRTLLAVERDGTRLVVRHLCEVEQCLLLLEERPIAAYQASFSSLGLTKREADVLHWVAQGQTNAEIGTILKISAETVRKHLQHVFGKLGVETRTAAVMRALALNFSQKSQ